MLRRAQHQLEIGSPRSRPSLVKHSAKRARSTVSASRPGRLDLRHARPNGAGKTTTLRLLLGIIDPSSGTRRLLGHDHPIDAARQVGYLPEERGLYPNMAARDAIAFMGALRGLPLREGRRRADELLGGHGLGEWARKPIRTLSKGMAQTVQCSVPSSTVRASRPRRAVSGSDAIKGELEDLIRRQARAGVTIIFSPMLSSRRAACGSVAIIVAGRWRSRGVD